MVTVDRQLLKDIGFTNGPVNGKYGWGHEVWVYNGWFRVHFKTSMTAEQKKRWPQSDTCVYAPCDRKRFFKLFLEKLRAEIADNYEVRDWED